jgi:hypothetical protein
LELRALAQTVPAFPAVFQRDYGVRSSPDNILKNNNKYRVQEINPRARRHR